ncbi:unnamed protein product, partial [Musa acuminata var. zebrina]
LESTSACDEALNILHSLPISEGGLLDLVTRHAGMIESLTTILRRSSFQSRAYATLLLRSMLGLALVAMDRLCGCAEGRAELVGHAAGIPVVSKKILRVSEMASERAVRILHSVARHSATPRLLQEMMQMGVVSKLCLVLQVDCKAKTKEKAKEILSMHSRVWRSSPCLSPQFQVSYPSS